LDRHLDILKNDKLLEREGTKGGVWILSRLKPDVGEKGGGKS
jgi:hypothetical protein